MSDLARFMMMIIALALLMFLNFRTLPEKQRETTGALLVSPEKKLPV